jgi:hypothetical protein
MVSREHRANLIRLPFGEGGKRGLQLPLAWFAARGCATGAVAAATTRAASTGPARVTRTTGTRAARSRDEQLALRPEPFADRLHALPLGLRQRDPFQRVAHPTLAVVAGSRSAPVAAATDVGGTACSGAVG